MAVYFITGKLGSGKSLQAVALMKRYIEDGKSVCTNIDLNLKYLVGAKAKYVKAFRIPDHPTSKDLLAVGRGNPGKEEENNGAMVLDECGIWFNSRNWNAKGRQDVINFMLMVRKLGWDVYFLVQNISVIDKQARDTLAEYVAYCVSIKKLHIPFVSPLYRSVTGNPLPLPKWHRAVVRYGTSHNGLKADSWSYRGTDLYSAYNTQQIFLTEAEDQAVYSYLPPIYYYKTPIYNLKNIMRLTKIYLKKYNRVGLVAAAVCAGIALQHFWNLTDPARFSELKQAAHSTPLTEEYGQYKIVSYSNLPGLGEAYTLSNGEKRLTSIQLIKSGVQVYSVDACALKLVKGAESIDLKCEV